MKKVYTEKTGPNGKPVAGRWIVRLLAKVYTPRVMRGSIESPSERVIRAKAEAKRERKRQQNLGARNMTYEKVKLTQVGDELTISVESCALATAGKYPGVLFQGRTIAGASVVLEVPQSAADRQLGRLNLHTYPAAIGKALTFSRAPNPADASKPFWNVSLAAKQTAPAREQIPEDEPLPEDAVTTASASSAIATGTLVFKPSPAREKILAQFRLYDACYEHAWRTVHARYSNTDTGEAVLAPVIASVAATLYIQANR